MTSKETEDLSDWADGSKASRYNIIDDFSKDWEVEPDGTIISKLHPFYAISGEQLKNKDWIKHLLEKKWVDMNTFIPAYFYALKMIGQKEILITANYSLCKELY